MLGLWVFSWLLGQDARRLIALKARILVERRVDRVRDLVLVSGFLVVPFAGDGRSEIDHFAGVFIDQQKVLVRVGLLFAAVVLLLLGRIDRALATAFSPINGQIRCPFPRQRVPRHAPG